VEPIRVLVADDHPLFRDGLRGLLASRDGFEVVGEAASGEEAVAVAVSAVPDVVVMDLHMPGLNGIHATRRIVAASPHTAVLVLTMFSDDDSVFAAMRAGARGYLLKGAGQVDIVQSIQAVARGEAVFGPAVANRVLVTSSRAAAWCLVWPQAVSLLRRCCAHRPRHEDHPWARHRCRPCRLDGHLAGRSHLASWTTSQSGVCIPDFRSRAGGSVSSRKELAESCLRRCGRLSPLWHCSAQVSSSDSQRSALRLGMKQYSPPRLTTNPARSVRRRRMGRWGMAVSWWARGARVPVGR